MKKETIIAKLACYHFTKNVLFSSQQHPGAFSAFCFISSFSTARAWEAGKPSLCQTRGGQSHNRCCLQACGLHQHCQVTKLAAAKPNRYAKEISNVLLFLSVIMKTCSGVYNRIGETHFQPSKILKGLEKSYSCFLSKWFINIFCMLLPFAIHNYRMGHFLIFQITWEECVVDCKFRVSLMNCIVGRLSWKI